MKPQRIKKENHVERSCFDVLKSWRLPTSIDLAQELVIVQEHVDEQIFEHVQQLLDPTHEPLRISSRVHRTLERLNLMMQDDTTN